MEEFNVMAKNKLFKTNQSKNNEFLFLFFSRHLSTQVSVSIMITAYFICPTNN